MSGNVTEIRTGDRFDNFRVTSNIWYLKSGYNMPKDFECEDVIVLVAGMGMTETWINALTRNK